IASTAATSAPAPAAADTAAMPAGPVPRTTTSASILRTGSATLPPSTGRARPCTSARCGVKSLTTSVGASAGSGADLGGEAGEVAGELSTVAPAAGQLVEHLLLPKTRSLAVDAGCTSQRPTVTATSRGCGSTAH